MQIINFISQSWALYSLLLFFLCVHKELHELKPFSKFLCIKLIIFFSFWQGFIISTLVRIGHIQSKYEHTSHEIAILYRSIMISFEMFIAVIGFIISFPISDFNKNHKKINYLQYISLLCLGKQ